jgi:hypothetical protein
MNLKRRDRSKTTDPGKLKMTRPHPIFQLRNLQHLFHGTHFRGELVRVGVLNDTGEFKIHDPYPAIISHQYICRPNVAVHNMQRMNCFKCLQNISLHLWRQIGEREGRCLPLDHRCREQYFDILEDQCVEKVEWTLDPKRGDIFTPKGSKVQVNRSFLIS